MKKEKINRSPLFYVGDKYKLIKEIKTYFPVGINRFIEPFVGGGSVFLNVTANEFYLNDINNHVIDIHNFLCSYAGKENAFFEQVFDIIRRYNLSFSFREDVIPGELKQQYKKTYYAHYNRENFCKLKQDYNISGQKSVAELYVLLIYGFNRMLRFNNKGDYNLPVGNVDFNKNTYNALVDYFQLTAGKQIRWTSLDFKEFINSIDYQENDFIYLDPPYLITFSEYNKLWNEQAEHDLLVVLDELNDRNVKFAISNVTHYKGKENTQFIRWAAKYITHPVSSNYISYHDNTQKKITEVLVKNYI